MKWLVLALLLTLTWEPSGLRVTWDAPEPVCLVLTGGGLPAARLADVPCAAAGDVVLRRGGDYLLSPVGRTVELRAQADLGRVVVSQEAAFVVRLPVVAAP